MLKIIYDIRTIERGLRGRVNFLEKGSYIEAEEGLFVNFLACKKQLGRSLSEAVFFTQTLLILLWDKTGKGTHLRSCRSIPGGESVLILS